MTKHKRDPITHEEYHAPPMFQTMLVLNFDEGNLQPDCKPIQAVGFKACLGP